MVPHSEDSVLHPHLFISAYRLASKGLNSLIIASSVKDPFLLLYIPVIKDYSLSYFLNIMVCLVNFSGTMVLDLKALSNNHHVIYNTKITYEKKNTSNSKL